MVATVSQLHSLDQSQTEWLSNHLGHSVGVHMSHYRVHTSVVEMGKVAKMLLMAEKGWTETFAGKNLKDVTVPGILINLLYLHTCTS